MNNLATRIKHMLAPSVCADHIYINNDADIICRVCGRKFGFVYGWEPTKVFIFEQYINMKRPIMKFVNSAVKPETFESNVKANEMTLSIMLDNAAHYLDNNMFSVEKDDDTQDSEELNFEDN